MGRKPSPTPSRQQCPNQPGNSSTGSVRRCRPQSSAGTQARPWGRPGKRSRSAPFAHCRHLCTADTPRQNHLDSMRELPEAEIKGVYAVERRSGWCVATKADDFGPNSAMVCDQSVTPASPRTSRACTTLQKMARQQPNCEPTCGAWPRSSRI